MAKHVAGLPGDRVAIDEEKRVLINGKPVVQGLPLLERFDDRIQRKFFGSKILAADEYWMTGDDFLSFDSRYWGPIRAKQIVGRAYVLF